MSSYRIVFCGPVGAGKTTAITALSDTPPILTEVQSDEARRAGKSTTTVAFDHGRVALPSGDQLLLYGTPGQARFDFMWPIVSENAVGAIVLANNESAQTINQTLEYVRRFAPRMPGGNCIVGVGRSERAPLPSVADYTDALQQAGYHLPVMNVDVRQRAHCVLLLNVLLSRLDAQRKLAG
ncbi:MAG TPA: ATP/GTP-binding protein [Burkholderiaceae bacterium]|nr:ATP/GTP-binding protein [Burkholderiaceae bacterium]